MKLNTTGRRDVTAFFEMSGIRFKKKEKHHPYIAFRRGTDGVKVEVVESPEQLLKMPARTKVMAQWAGKSRSDFFQFTVGQLRTHLKKNPKHACQVI